EVRRLRDDLALKALEPKTRTDYARALRQWTAFALAMGEDWIPSIDTLSAFVAWRYATVSTVYQTLSGLAYTFESIMGVQAWKSVRESRLVKDVIVGGRKWWRRSPKRAPPLPFAPLDFALRAALSLPSIPYDRLLFLAMVALGFASCARGAELTLPSTIRYRDPGKLPLRSTVMASRDHFSVHLPYHKADRKWSGSHLLFVASGTSVAFTNILLRYLAERDAR
ncbi:hypothetical protein JCM5296_000281, partial [Sporobolomyces johnsonii]